MRSCLIFVFLVGCGSGELVVEDAGQDAVTDTAAPKPDAAKDAPADSPADTGKDTGIDAEVDAGVDAEPDTGVIDSGPDVIVIDGGGPDSGVMCGKKGGIGFMGMNSCGVTESYKCGNDAYDIDCQCPAAQCICKKNGQTVNTINNVAGCPQCQFNFANIAAQCNIPY